MKYIYQLGIILGVSFAGELLHSLLPLPAPASIYGLVLLLALLQFKVVKLGQVEETADYFLLVMPLLFVEPTVKLMSVYDVLKDSILPLVAACALSTVIALAVTGRVSQYIIRRRRRGGHE